MRLRSQPRLLSGGLVVAAVLVASFAPASGAARPASALTIGPAGNATTTNWAGYAATPKGGSYSRVSAYWQQPAVTCTSTDSAALFWVGIDGYTSSTAEQVGTLALCQHRVASYYTWWEMSPSGIQIVGTQVSPGDPIAASVQRHGSTYELRLRDHEDRNNSFEVTQFCDTCDNSSVEWIAERAAVSGVFEPLANFGKMGFKRVHAASSKGEGSILAFPYDVITMVNDDGDRLVSPSKLKKAGNRFNENWLQVG